MGPTPPSFVTTPDGLHGVELFVVLVAIASAAALVTSRMSMPYSVALIVAGLIVGAAIPPEALEVTPDLILAVLVPGLVFEASFKLDVAELRKSSGVVAILAIPGVLITAAVVAIVASMSTGLDPALGFLLGAIVSATDPVAVIELFKRLDAPSRLATVVDAEALFNDGTGVMLFAIALVAVTQPVGIAEGAVALASTVLISGILGVLAGVVRDRTYVLDRSPPDPEPRSPSSPPTGPTWWHSAWSSPGSSPRSQRASSSDGPASVAASRNRRWPPWTASGASPPS